MSRAAEKILVIKLGAFGDVVQADGALRDIRAFHPGAEIVLLTTPPFRKLMDRCPHVDRVLTDSRAPRWKIGAWIRLASMLRNERFTRAYDLQRQGRTELYHKLFLRNVAWSGKQKANGRNQGSTAWLSS